MKLSDAILAWILVVLAAIVFAAVLGMVYTKPAKAQQQTAYQIMCFPPGELTKHLTEQGERMMAVGQSGTEENPYTAQFWLNRSTLEWTVVFFVPDKVECMVAGGKSFRAVPFGGSSAPSEGQK